MEDITISENERREAARRLAAAGGSQPEINDIPRRRPDVEAEDDSD
jgi:hypothetical protein